MEGYATGHKFVNALRGTIASQSSIYLQRCRRILHSIRCSFKHFKLKYPKSCSKLKQAFVCTYCKYVRYLNLFRTVITVCTYGRRECTTCLLVCNRSCCGKLVSVSDRYCAMRLDAGVSPSIIGLSRPYHRGCCPSICPLDDVIGD